MKLLGADKILHIIRENIQKGKCIAVRPGLGDHRHLRGAAVRLGINKRDQMQETKFLRS